MSATFILKRHGINIVKREADGKDTPILANQEFVLDAPGIYTIEGPNQAGKSVLIKLLMGALPPTFDHAKASGSTYLFGSDQPVLIHSVRDAQRHGLAAVFQDESLIPTMTIREQLLMRHAEPTARACLSFLWKRMYERWFVGIVSNMNKDIGDRLKAWRPLQSSARKDTINQIATQSLRRFDREAILDQLPIELSGGQRAVARLVSAQLVPGVRLLFLDEAFANVDRQTWPALIDALKQWQREGSEEGRTIVAVSHSSDELLRWQPRRRFRITDGHLQEDRTKGYVSLHRSHPRRIRSIPVFEHPYTGLALDVDAGLPFLVTTRTITDKYKHALDDVLQVLRRISTEEPEVVCIAGDETDKTLDGCIALTNKLLTASQRYRRPGPVALVGGGALLNMAGFAMGSLYRGRSPLVYVPTTLTAIADVVIGSKTAINFQTRDPVTEAPKAYKNCLGAYIDPSAVLLDRAFLEYLPIKERKLGLTECLKHGLLQDQDLFDEIVDVLSDPIPDITRSYDIARRVLSMKSEVLLRFPWETDGGKVLRFGHLLAHALERASNYRIHHGSSVLWGMLVELRVAGAPEIYDRLKAVVRAMGDIGQTEWVKVCPDAVLDYAHTDPHESLAPFRAIEVHRIGEYGDPVSEQLNLRDVAVGILRDAISEVNREVAAPKSAAGLTTGR